MKASEVMRSPAVSVAPNCRVIDAVRLLMETNRRGLPVVDSSGILVGIVSEGDFLRQRWAAGAIVDVVVTNGEVQMWGVIVDPTQRNALKVLIENVSGVDHVTDHLKLRDELPL
jgi:CBS domain-containing protein